MPIGVYSHNHYQETAALKWTVTHNLGTFAPVVDIITMYEGVLQKIIPQAVKIIDNRTVEISFSVARTGTAAVR